MLVVARIGVGYDAVDVPALTAKKIPLMVAGTANSPSVAEQAMFMMMALAKRGAELNAMVQGGAVEQAGSGAVPVDLFGKTVLIVGFGRIGTRSAKRCLAMEMKVLGLRPLSSRPPRSRRRAASRWRTSTPPCRVPISSPSIAPRRPRRSACSMPRGWQRMKPTAYLVNTRARRHHRRSRPCIRR